MATIRQSIAVNAPVHTLYQQLILFEEYPRFMQEVESISRLDDTHLHWKAHMAGRLLEWDVELSELQADRSMAWRDLGGPSGAGRVEVQPDGESGSRLTFTLHSPAEWQPMQQEMEERTQRLREGLERFKDIVESRAVRSSHAAGTDSLAGTEEAVSQASPVARRTAAALRNDSAGSVSKQWSSYDRNEPATKERTMQTVSEVMTPDVSFVSPGESLQRAAQMMDELNVGSLPVCDGGSLIGMITDRDITVRGTAAGKVPAETHVDEVMSTDVRWCFEDQTLDEVMQTMGDTQIRRVPVISHDDAHKLIGIVSLGDLATKTSGENKRDVEGVAERIASPSEPDRSSPARQARAGSAMAPGTTARIDPSGGFAGPRGAGNKDDSGSNSAGADDAGTAGSGGSDLGR